MKPITDLIPGYLLGILPAAQRREVDDAVAASPSLRREVDALAEALAQGAAGALTPLSPPPALRDRLLATVGGVDRFAPFLDDLTALFELPVETIRGLLARIDDPGVRSGVAWERQLLGVPLEATELFHFPVGPRLAATGAAGGVLRVRAGSAFIAHRHTGDEVTYVLEGGCLDGACLLGPGERIVMEAGTSHDLRSAPERDLVVMVLHRGIALPA